MSITPAATGAATIARRRELLNSDVRFHSAVSELQSLLTEMHGTSATAAPIDPPVFVHPTRAPAPRVSVADARAASESAHPTPAASRASTSDSTLVEVAPGSKTPLARLNFAASARQQQTDSASPMATSQAAPSPDSVTEVASARPESGSTSARSLRDRVAKQRMVVDAAAHQNAQILGRREEAEAARRQLEQAQVDRERERARRRAEREERVHRQLAPAEPVVERHDDPVATVTPAPATPELQEAPFEQPESHVEPSSAGPSPRHLDDVEDEASVRLRAREVRLAQQEADRCESERQQQAAETRRAVRQATADLSWHEGVARSTLRDEEDTARRLEIDAPFRVMTSEMEATLVSEREGRHALQSAETAAILVRRQVLLLDIVGTTRATIVADWFLDAQALQDDFVLSARLLQLVERERLGRDTITFEEAAVLSPPARVFVLRLVELFDRQLWRLVNVEADARLRVELDEEEAFITWLGGYTRSLPLVLAYHDRVAAARAEWVEHIAGKLRDTVETETARRILLRREEDSTFATLETTEEDKRRATQSAEEARRRSEVQLAIAQAMSYGGVAPAPNDTVVYVKVGGSADQGAAKSSKAAASKRSSSRK